MGTTYTLGSHDFVSSNQMSQPWQEKTRVFVLKNTVDFALKNVVSDTDAVIEVLNIPANCAVLGTWLYVHTADAGVTDIDVGLGEGVEFMEQVNPSTVGYKHDTDQTNNIGGSAPGKIFTSADTLDISIQGVQTADTLKITLFALCVDLTI